MDFVAGVILCGWLRCVLVGCVNCEWGFVMSVDECVFVVGLSVCLCDVGCMLVS